MKNSEYKIEQILPQLEGIYKKDPVKFEKIRKQIIRDTIDTFPKEFQQRAYGIQFSLDHELGKIKNPVVRMNRMVEIFWEKVSEFQAVVNDPTGVIAERENKKKTAKVIPLF